VFFQKIQLGRSLRRLEIKAKPFSGPKRTYLLKNIPAFKSYILQKYVLTSIHRSVSPSHFAFDYLATFPIPGFSVFNIPAFSKKTSSGIHPVPSRLEILKKLLEFSASLIDNDISIYNGSKSEDSPGAVVFAPDLKLYI